MLKPADAGILFGIKANCGNEPAFEVPPADIKFYGQIVDINGAICLVDHGDTAADQTVCGVWLQLMQ